jgi:hypothetical protein
LEKYKSPPEAERKMNRKEEADNKKIILRSAQDDKGKKIKK